MSIGTWAFVGCTSLTSITIPDGVPSIGDFTFAGCSSLTSISISNGVTSIGGAAFSYCTSLASITFLGSAPALGENCFENVTATAYYPADDTTWTEDVCQNYGGTITWVAYEPEPTTIASGQCGDDLTWTLDSDGLLTITGTGDMWDYYGVNNFNDWGGYLNQIRSLVILDGATDIGNESFRNCANMTSAIIPDSVKIIKPSAFAACTSLSSVSLSEGLKTIDIGAFYFCLSLTMIQIPDSVEYIGSGAFEGCSSMTEIKVSNNNSYYQSKDGILFSKNGSLLHTFPNGRGGAYEVPFGVTSIGKSAFSSCEQIDYIKIADSVHSIGDGAFTYCRNLRNITIPDKVVNIGDYVFYDCYNLMHISIGKSVTSIGSMAFGACNCLTELRFEGVAPAINGNAFSGVTATAYYPSNDPSWTEEVRQDYGGHITWVPYGEAPEGYAITIEDYTKGKATVEGIDEDGRFSGEVSFTVSTPNDQAVIAAIKSVAADGTESYAVVPCSTDGNGVHSFTVTVEADLTVALVFRGDANLDGVVDGKDGNMVSRYAVHKFSITNPLALLAVDVDGSGTIDGKDGNMISRFAVHKFTIPW